MDSIPLIAMHSIEMDAAHWRLGDESSPLIEATAQGITLAPHLAQQQGLPAPHLPVEQIRQVVAGWVPEAAAWQVGLYWGEEDALQWAVLVMWPVDSEHAAAQAQHTAEHLSSVMGVTYSLVDNESAAAPEQTIPLMPLPVSMGEWALRMGPRGPMWTVTRQRQLRFGMRVVFFLVAAVMFVVLGGGALRSGLAEVSPAWLPMAAFGVAMVVSYSALENLFAVLLHKRVVVDTHERELRSERAMTGLVDWRIPFDTLEYLLVSQEPARPFGRRRRDDPMQIEQDVWVHAYDGEQFWLLMTLSENRGRSHRWERVRHENDTLPRRPLDLADYDSPVHHAALHTAQTLDVPVYVDIR